MTRDEEDTPGLQGPGRDDIEVGGEDESEAAPADGLADDEAVAAEDDDDLEAEYASHGAVDLSSLTPPLPVAPSTSGKASNALAKRLLPAAFWKLEDLCFDFDRYFIKPHAKRAFRQLARLKATLPGAPVTLFGHADPVGQDSYNKKLSEKRARMVYGVLTRDASVWASVYQGEDESTRLLQSRLKAMGWYDGAVDGVLGSRTRQGISAYIDDLAGDLRLGTEDFLAGGKCAFQGCGEFNPVRLVSSKMDTFLQQPEHRQGRAIENQPNRRVVAVFFEEGTEADPSWWPCPAASEGVSGCKKRFWSDWRERRKLRDYPRQFDEDPERHGDVGPEEEISEGYMVMDRVDVDDDLLGGLRYIPSDDTFACRFYEHLARLSGCEREIHEPFFVEVLLADPEDEGFEELDYSFASDGYTSSGTTRDGIVTEWLPTGASFYQLEWDAPAARGKDSEAEDGQKQAPRSITVGLGWAVGETKTGLFFGSLEEEEGV
jgi:outer membrane protein OmpA-like peptidoglycan-associated protein